MGRNFCRFVTIQAFDKQTDRQTDGQLSHGYTVRYITGSRTVKRTEVRLFFLNYTSLMPTYELQMYHYTL